MRSHEREQSSQNKRSSTVVCPFCNSTLSAKSIKRHLKASHAVEETGLALRYKVLNNTASLYMIRTQTNGAPYVSYVRYINQVATCSGSRLNCHPTSCIHVKTIISQDPDATVAHIPKQFIMSAIWLSEEQLQTILRLRVPSRTYLSFSTAH